MYFSVNEVALDAMGTSWVSLALLEPIASCVLGVGAFLVAPQEAVLGAIIGIAARVLVNKAAEVLETSSPLTKWEWMLVNAWFSGVLLSFHSFGLANANPMVKGYVAEVSITNLVSNITMLLSEEGDEPFLENRVGEQPQAV